MIHEKQAYILLKQLYPRTREANYNFRARLRSTAAHDPMMQAALYAKCSEGVEGLLFWMNSFCWVYEPREDHRANHDSTIPHLPFITYTYQDEYVKDVYNAIFAGKNLLTEKSRDMGATWIVLTVFQWFWQFGSAGNDFLLGSRKEAYVDKFGDMDTLFEKLRYQLKRQPTFLLPDGFDINNHTKYMNIINPATGSNIVGEANNKFFGTGGRRKAVFFDEFAKWEHTDAAAWQSCSDVTQCKIVVSSAHGKQNHFYKLRAGKAGVIKKVKLHWRKHPHKDNAWYAAEKKRRSVADVAAEIDIDYSASVSNKAYESYDPAVHIGHVDYNPKVAITLMCDFNIDPMSWVLAHEYGPRCEIFGEIILHTTSTAMATKHFINRFKNHRFKHVEIYGDATGQHRQRAAAGLVSDYSIMTNMLEAAGWSYVLNLPKGNPEITASLDAANKRLKDWENGGKSWVLISDVVSESPDEGCEVLQESFEQTQRKDAGIDKSDNIEHPTDGFRYWANRKYPTVNKGEFFIGER